MANPRNMSVHPHQGRQLPRDWAATARSRAQQADEDYEQRMSAAWRQPLTYGTARLAELGIVSLTKSAQLSQQNTDSLSRSDRFDSELRLIGRTDDGFEVWSDGHGTTIRRRKQ
jgi:hypothetical protein